MKVRSVGRMARLFKNLRENNEVLLDIKEMSMDGKIPRGLLMQGRPAIKDTFKEYLLARDLDGQNEKRPNRSPEKGSLTSRSNDSMLI